MELNGGTKRVLKLAGSMILVGIIVWKLGGVGEVGSVLERIDPFYVFLVILVFMADRVLMTFKWVRLLRSKGIRIPLANGMMIYCSSMIWGMFLPTTLGADAVRVFSTSRTGHDPNEIVASIVVERLLGFIASLLFTLFGLLILFQSGILGTRFRYALWGGGVALVTAMLVFITSFSQRAFDFLHVKILRRYQNTRLVHRFRQFHQAYYSFQNDKACLAEFFSLSFLEQAMPVLDSWLIARSLGVDVSLLFVAGALPIAQLISRIPISIDGLGVYEGAFILVMSLAGVTASEAVAIAVTGRVLQTASWLPWWMAHGIRTGSLKPPGTVPIKG
jgi:glycosyltransferase 2 family protein